MLSYDEMILGNYGEVIQTLNFVHEKQTILTHLPIISPLKKGGEYDLFTHLISFKQILLNIHHRNILYVFINVEYKWVKKVISGAISDWLHLYQTEN